MYATLSFVLFAATIVFGAVLERGGDGFCNTGPVQCCEKIQTPDSENYPSTLYALFTQGSLKEFDAFAEALAGPIGTGCVPATVPSVGADVGHSCQGTTTCCNNVTDKLVGVNCMPISINI